MECRQGVSLGLRLAGTRSYRARFLFLLPLPPLASLLALFHLQRYQGYRPAPGICAPHFCTSLLVLAAAILRPVRLQHR
jgi:hypothetical protein